CDVKLPDGNGVHFIAGIKQKFPMIEIILLTAYGNIADGVQAMKNGAFDYIVKGDDNDKVIPLLHKAMEKVTLQKRVLFLQKQIGNQYNFDSITGTSKTIVAAKELAKKVAPTDATVLLTGETGTGKEVFAQAVHNGSKRADKIFLAVNCNAFSKELLESEIFGYKAGAFTGAIKDKKGLMEEAHEGSLFLDEIGEMPMDLQSKLLRVLETSEFIKVGDTKPTKVNVRFIAATNRNLIQEVEKGTFREDLFYRLNVFSIELPPLRDRKSDVLLLADIFLKLFSEKVNKKTKELSEEAKTALKNYQWKGNIRELKNMIERAVILEDNDIVDVDVLQGLQFVFADNLMSYDLSVVEKHHIQKVLQHTNGNKTETARLLNIALTTLYRKMEEYGLPK
ncbi:MAG: sigma-54 dependent transcriptional regulator, partial [Bacteroidota bacterium]|nr:sigma-54 dependent transcriptional regulator [Bacteroidota bacterium]